MRTVQSSKPIAAVNAKKPPISPGGFFYAYQLGVSAAGGGGGGSGSQAPLAP